MVLVWVRVWILNFLLSMISYFCFQRWRIELYVSSRGESRRVWRRRRGYRRWWRCSSVSCGRWSWRVIDNNHAICFVAYVLFLPFNWILGLTCCCLLIEACLSSSLFSRGSPTAINFVSNPCTPTVPRFALYKCCFMECVDLGIFTTMKYGHSNPLPCPVSDTRPCQCPILTRHPYYVLYFGHYRCLRVCVRVVFSVRVGVSAS